MDYIGDLNARLVDEFLEKWNHIPVFDGPVDTDIRAYCVMLAEWVRGNDSWSFEGGRYFGDKGREIQTTRLVRLTGIRGEKKISTSCRG
ncbi:hypothetical protein PTI98_005437 [Pleurotus ostreatus]|nr:hypothetical protein PTI98_005437 [Pleurotus ostreatus]